MFKKMLNVKEGYKMLKNVEKRLKKVKKVKC